MMATLDDRYSAAVKDQLMEAFIANELGDEFRECYPEKGLHYLTGIGIPLVQGKGLKNTEELLAAVLRWLTAWDQEGRSTNAYAGADAIRPFLEIVFLDAWEHGRVPYADDPHDIDLMVEELAE